MNRFLIAFLLALVFSGLSFGQKNDTIPTINVLKGVVANKEYHAILINSRGGEFSGYDKSLKIFNKNGEILECGFYQFENEKEKKCYINLSNNLESRSHFVFEAGKLKYKQDRQTIDFKEDKDWNHFFALDSTSITNVEVTYDNETRNKYNNSYSFQTIWKNHPQLKKLQFLTQKFPSKIENTTFYEIENTKSTEESDIYNYYDMKWNAPFYFDDEIIVFSNSLDIYLGGAHGLPTVDYETYSLKSGQKLLLSDFIDVEKHQFQLEELLQKAAKEYAENEMTLDENFPISDAYYFGPKGITFSYNPYQIAGFAAGIIELFIPYSDIKNYNPKSEIAQMYLKK